MARRKLTKTQKARNKAAYKNIRKEYEKVKDKAPVSYVQFKRRVKSRAAKDNISIKEAAKKEARTETFFSAGERSRENLLTGIKEKHGAAYSELKNLSRSKGKFQSIKDNLTWDKDRKGYVLNAEGKQYFIDVTNSPEEVTITEIN
jgi:coproporphyrinogen III oxidase-like Fe-S oxidoreductase